ncbi:MAG TPA: fatty acid hydroxylase, partial [Verrucomicrobiales bacterium]|nr:fatty acid hydroxylase [Verrucomicrobiales bacterium]
MNFLFWMAVGAIVCVVFASFFEWSLHRFLMHRPLGSFTYPFEAHALVHHKTFRADHSYHLIDERDKKTIPMAWWNGPVLVAIGITPFVAVAWATGHWGLLVGAGIACTAYYATYEYLHWCMHLPRNRSLERSGLFFRLNGHHLLHHRYMG